MGVGFMPSPDRKGHGIDERLPQKSVLEQMDVLTALAE
jgi:hypothetical protein